MVTTASSQPPAEIPETAALTEHYQPLASAFVSLYRSPESGSPMYW